jgi:DNA-binding GntR family transcriptional regulator
MNEQITSARLAVRTEAGAEDSLSQRAYEAIRADIMMCRLRPLEKVSEAKLALRLGMGKAPIRNALSRLSQEGLLTAKARSGFVVVPLTAKDILECFQMRLALEPLAASLAAARLNADTIEDLRRLAQPLHRGPTGETSEADRYAIFQADQAFHRKVAEASGNSRLAASVSDLLDHVSRALYMGMLQPGEVDEFGAGNLELTSALLEGDAAAAERIAREHIRIGLRMVVRTLMENADPV